jgi:kynurenine formamidase
MPPRFVEVSHVIEPGMVTYPGLPVPVASVIVDHDTSRDRYAGKSEFLTAEACDLLVRAGAAFVGIDSLNIDDMADLARPAHTILLGAGIPICEHMTNLAELPPDAGHLHAVPIAWRGGATFPVRAYVQL